MKPSPRSAPASPRPARTVLDMTGYQWTVILAAWLGWGFDVFDGLLFNYVAPTCVPTLLGLTIGSPEAKAASIKWAGALTSLLLVGWAVGGIFFGRVADRLGRTHTLLLTMGLYSIGTAACAAAPNMFVLVICRIIASLGIGGEWAAGAAMVAEVVPEKRRVEAGAILYTAAPLGLFLASAVTHQIQGVLFPGSPETSWRYVFLCGLVPATVALLVRVFVKEPERWQRIAARAHPRFSELFQPEYRAITISGTLMAFIALATWWSSNAFLPTVVSGIAQQAAAAQGLTKEAAQILTENWKATAANWFNFGGLLGTLLTIPMAKRLGRRPMFFTYYLLSGLMIMGAFGLDLAPKTRLVAYFLVGLTTFGVFGSFTYYLPELFPTRLRGTGAGFCYNLGRMVAAGGPFLVGSIASAPGGPMKAMHVLVWVGLVPLLGLALMPWVVETKGRPLLE